MSGSRYVRYALKPFKLNHSIPVGRAACFLGGPSGPAPPENVDLSGYSISYAALPRCFEWRADWEASPLRKSDDALVAPERATSTHRLPVETVQPEPASPQPPEEIGRDAGEREIGHPGRPERVDITVFTQGRGNIVQDIIRKEKSDGLRNAHGRAHAHA
jgi:hypothetical protein